ncbi:MAG: cell division protein FtsQ/DivIB [Pseudomonadota bacterium]
MQPLKSLRDPAPSRSAYRLQRLWLTPGVRLFLRWGVPVTCIAVAVGLWAADEGRRAALVEAAAELRRDVQERPEFMVKLLAIDGASPEVADDLRDVLALELPVSSFDLDLPTIRTQAEGVDAVREASVRVRSGGILELTVGERVPVVVWRGRDGLRTLDEGGHRVAALTARSVRADLPLVAGEGADRAVAEAMALFEIAKPLGPRIRGLLRIGERRWDLVLDRDQRVLLPETDPGSALERVIALDQVRLLLSRDIAVVDMRNPKRPTLRMNAHAAAVFRGGGTPEEDI